MNNINKIINGAKGLGKYALGIDKSPEELIKDREEVCNNCEHLRKTLLGLSMIKKCAICGCVLKAKWAIKGEKCP